MSIALRRVRDRIRIRLRDTDARLPTYSLVEYDQAIAEAYLVLQGRLPAAELYTASAFTITGGGDTFTLPNTVSQYTGNDGGAEYRGNFRIQLNSTKDFLVQVTQEQLDALRDGNSATATSIPQFFALWEENDQDVQGRCYPGTTDAQVCNLFRAMSADDLRDFVGSGTDDMDDVEVLFSRIAATALVNTVAAEMLLKMTKEDRALRKINTDVIPKWESYAELALLSEYSRRQDVETTGEVERWVS